VATEPRRPKERSIFCHFFSFPISRPTSDGRRTCPSLSRMGSPRYVCSRNWQTWPLKLCLAGVPDEDTVRANSYPEISGAVFLDGHNLIGRKSAVSRKDSSPSNIHSAEFQPATVPERIASINTPLACAPDVPGGWGKLGMAKSCVPGEESSSTSPASVARNVCPLPSDWIPCNVDTVLKGVTSFSKRLPKSR
jgi:hypothetical protein